ncbi:MAG: hypothetical protein KDG51_22100, partial [Calditrichaeota bacterium]|nr:hypothetical protein [Calditrichota bacterium]
MIARLFVTLLIVAMLGLFSSCEEESPFSPNQPGALEKGGQNAGTGNITAMTWNVYVGADVDAILAAPPDQIPFVVGGAFADLYDTDFHLRAVAIVDQIAEHNPHLIALQEISLIRIQIPGDFMIGNPVAAEQIEFDYLDILIAELASRGLDYEVGAKVQNADVELPMLNPFTYSLDDVRLTDYDVVLVRGDVAFDNPTAVNYGTFLSVPVPFMPPMDILRGYAAVDATVG